MAVLLRNPHSVLAALHTRPESVLEIRLATDAANGVWQDVVELAKRHGVRVSRRGHQREQKQSQKEQRGSSAEATIKERPPTLLTDLFQPPASGPFPLWLALDCLQDPHNVGAIFRTAAFWNVRGIVLTKDRAAPLNATVYDVASGGLEYVPHALEANLGHCLEVAKKAGLWILGSSEHAGDDVQRIPRDRPWLLVVGNEETGLRRLTESKCDQMCKLTPRGPIQSLNVSVATGTLISALLRSEG